VCVSGMLKIRFGCTLQYAVLLASHSNRSNLLSVQNMLLERRAAAALHMCRFRICAAANAYDHDEELADIAGF
jgi:hypothetical protein